MKSTNKNTLRLVTSGVLIGLGTILSMIKIFAIPFGGSVTLFSMVPLLVLGYMYKIKWGLLCGFVYGVLQMILGATMSSAFVGLTGISILLMVILDYLLSYMSLGLSGMFKNKIKNDKASIIAGSSIAVLLRFVCHFLSGWILWGSYADSWFSDMGNSFGNFFISHFTGQLLAICYSFLYNALYLVPEYIISIIALLIIMNIKPLAKYIIGENSRI